MFLSVSEATEKPFMKFRQAVIRAFTSRIFLTKVFVALIFAILLLSSEGWEEKNIVLEEALYLLGVVAVAACLVGRAWSLSYISGSKDSRLITTGPYSISRNPLYFANFLGAVGLGLCTETLTVTLVTIITFAVYYPRVIAAEEKRLLELFGEDFESYRRRVPRFFPAFKGLVEDEEMLVSVRAFRNGLRDLGAIVLALGLLEFIESLHRAHVLPTLFTLY
jgi:protein-S-isoprenylcysteine O-methyltransferase Ste14